jgi:hypothetical protein
VIVADALDATDFRKTEELPGNGGEQSFIMTKLGTTRVDCAIHPNMTGVLIVREHLSTSRRIDADLAGKTMLSYR